MIDPVEAQPESIPAFNQMAAPSDDWLAAVEGAASAPIAPQSSSDLGRIGSGEGSFFISQSTSGPVYRRIFEPRVAQDGRVVDDRGRQVLGYAATGGNLTALRVRTTDPFGQPFARIEVDDRGRLFGIPSAASKQQISDPVLLGKLGVAVFAAPQNLKPSDQPFPGFQDADRNQCTAAGAPISLPADAPNLAAISHNPMHVGSETMRTALRERWWATARAEIDLATTGAEDAMVRVALGVVK